VDSIRYLAIVNPMSKSGKTEMLLADIKTKLSNLDVTYQETTHPQHAIDLAAGAMDYDAVIAIGGDGTIHEIVNGLMRIDETARPALAVIPCGSGNDTCRMIGSPLTIDEAIEVIKTGGRKTFDLGLCNETYFVNSFSIGIDAHTVARTRDLKEKTGRSGMLLYGQALLGIILRNMMQTSIEITVHETTENREVLLLAFTNGQTYGGGFRINPLAQPDDGTLTMTRIDSMSRSRVLSCIPSLLRATHLSRHEVWTQEVTHITCASADGQSLIAQIDGELIKGRIFRIEVRPHAFEFITRKS
jgi:YegS/Rv2252/BmrU family lipid kinase